MVRLGAQGLVVEEVVVGGPLGQDALRRRQQPVGGRCVAGWVSIISRPKLAVRTLSSWPG